MSRQKRICSKHEINSWNFIRIDFSGQKEPKNTLQMSVRLTYHGQKYQNEWFTNICKVPFSWSKESKWIFVKLTLHSQRNQNEYFTNVCEIDSSWSKESRWIYAQIYKVDFQWSRHQNNKV